MEQLDRLDESFARIFSSVRVLVSRFCGVQEAAYLVGYNNRLGISF